MKPLTTLVILMALSLTGYQSNAQAQTNGLWGNILQGVTGSKPSNPLQNPLENGQKLLGLFGNSGNTSGLTQGLGGLPNLLQGIGGAQSDGGAKAGPTDLLSRVNQKSKDAIDRTTQWAQQKKQEMNSKMFSGALGLLKPKTANAQGATTAGPFDWLKPKGNTLSNQPPIRAAENYGQQPSIRY